MKLSETAMRRTYRLKSFRSCNPSFISWLSLFTIGMLSLKCVLVDYMSNRCFISGALIRVEEHFFSSGYEMHWHYTPSSSLFSSAGGWWLRHSQKDGGGRVKRQNRPFTEHPLFTSPFLRIGSRCSSLERSLFLCHSFNGSISLNDVPRLYSLSLVTPAILKCYRAWDSSVHVLGYFRTVREVDYRAIQCGGEGREEGVCVCVYILYFFFKGGFFCIYFGPVFFKDDLGLQGVCVCKRYIYIWLDAWFQCDTLQAWSANQNIHVGFNN